MPKSYELNTWGMISHVVLYKTTYANNNTLAVIVEDSDGCPFATLTVNSSFSGGLPENMQFLDVNNCPWAPAFLQEHGLAKPMGKALRSGFCEYPLYEFDLTKIPEHI